MAILWHSCCVLLKWPQKQASVFLASSAFPKRGLKRRVVAVLVLLGVTSDPGNRVLTSAWEKCSPSQHIYIFNYVFLPINDFCLVFEKWCYECNDYAIQIFQSYMSVLVFNYICTRILLLFLHLFLTKQSFKTVYLWCKRESKQEFSFILRSFSLEFKSGIYVFFSCKSTIKATW